MKSYCWGLAMFVVGGGFAVSPLGASIVKETAPRYVRMERAVAVPAELCDHVLFVNITVNGQGPFRVFVDTGCSFTLLSPELAAAVKTQPAPDADPATVAFNSVGNLLAVPRVLVDSIELGGVRFEGVIAGVLPMAGLSQIDGRRIDGALGFSLFSEVFLGLDYPGQRVLLAADWPENLPPLRAELNVHERAEVPFVTAELQGQSFEVEIDSGSNGSLHVTRDLAAGLSWKTRPRPGPLIEAVDEEARDLLGRLGGQLTMGDLGIPEPVASVGGAMPSIGYDVLGRFCIVFDQRADKVRFYSRDTATIPSPSERSVGLSIKLDPAGWRVAGVIPGSPAEEARVVTGDLLARIEDRPASAWTRDQIHDWVETHDTLLVGVVNHTGTRDIKLRVWLLVP